MILESVSKSEKASRLVLTDEDSSVVAVGDGVNESRRRQTISLGNH